MGEIEKVYLSSKIPLTFEQKCDCLTDLDEKAKSGFLIEIQKEVMAHTSEETFIFTVQKIEPKNKFYGMVDDTTIFVIMLPEDTLPPMPPAPKSDPDAVEKITQLSEKLFPFPSEVERLRNFIVELEELRIKHNISWGCLHNVVSSIEWFGDETAPRL